jgi:putative membrane protein insertion efficiency factor
MPPALKPVPLGVRVALFALRFYKSYLSLLFAGSCRFEPTCSRYAYQAVEQFGVARGSWLTLKRLLRCQPFSRKFGYDPVPEAWEATVPAALVGAEADHAAGVRQEVQP